MPFGAESRVAHVSPALFGSGGLIGGGERFPLELARAMSARAQTTLFSFSGSSGHRSEGTLPIRVLRNWLPRGRFVVDPLAPSLLRELAPFDVIHYHQTQTLMSSAALLYARAKGKPIFTTHLGGGGLSLQAIADVSHLYAMHLHISEFSRRVFGHAERANARVILGGVDTERFSPGDGTALARREVLFVGRLLPHKGINYLIEAVDRTTPLRIVGRRWWRRHDTFYGLLQDLARTKTVSVEERVDDEALVDAYRSALCVVLPSVYTTFEGEEYKIPELLGQTLLEGMACGIPAICTNVGAMPEVVEDGVTGFVVPPNDARALGEKIAWLIDNPGAAKAMGQAARRRVLERFTWNAVVDRCFDAYASA